MRSLSLANMPTSPKLLPLYPVRHSADCNAPFKHHSHYELVQQAHCSPGRELIPNIFQSSQKICWCRVESGSAGEVNTMLNVINENIRTHFGSQDV